jgi:LuxR family transcriptional regulator, maltose regulon positive regulatory protein
MTAHSYLLPAKLDSPRLGVKTLARARLCEQLDRSLERDVTIVVAPAGFGKSVLLADWMAHRTLPTAWLSLDANDNHLPTFVRYLALSIETLFPDGCRETLSLVEAQLPPIPGQLTDSLLAEIGDLPEPFILILDDYHVLINPDIHILVMSLIDHVPHQLHVIIGTRTDPPLPLSRWRLSGLLGEVRASDVRFDLIEARELLRQLLEVEIPPRVSEAIAARTEGWAAGLRLAALSLQGRSDLSTLSLDSLGRNRYIMDYLMDEVFSRQPPELQDLLLKSSILDWMSEPLIAVLMTSSTDYPTTVSLSQLLSAGLFVDLVNEQAGTYRYHELFRDLLRQRLTAQVTPQAIAILHHEASRWLAEHGYFEEAVRHALAAGDQLAAARVVEENIHALLNLEAKTRLESLLDLLPPQLIEEHAPLLIARAWIMHFETRLNAIPPLLQRAGQLLQTADVLSEEEMRSWQGDIATLQSQLLYWQSKGQQGLDIATQAIAATPSSHNFARGNALFFAGLNQHMISDTTAAKRLLRENLSQGTAASAVMSLRLLLGLCIIQQDVLNIEQLQATAKNLLRQAEAGGLLVSKAWGHLFLGKASYEWDDLETAQFHFLAGAALRQTANAACTHDCLANLALTYAAQGLGKRADETAATLVEFDSAPLSPERLGHTQSLRARLALTRGDRDSAQRWLLSADPEPFLVPAPFLEVASVTRIRVLLALETQDRALQALDLAQQLQRDAEAISSALRLVQALALQALALDALGDERRALRVLQNTIGLARPGGLIRTLVDLGPALGNLLQRLLKSRLVTRPGADEYMARLLAAFPTLRASVAARHSADLNDNLIESLTEREVQVLDLLALRQTDREIADTLVISPFTVRRHIDNISDKIGVRGRHALVERARNLKLIPPT